MRRFGRNPQCWVFFAQVMALLMLLSKHHLNEERLGNYFAFNYFQSLWHGDPLQRWWQTQQVFRWIKGEFCLMLNITLLLMLIYVELLFLPICKNKPWFCHQTSKNEQSFVLINLFLTNPVGLLLWFQPTPTPDSLYVALQCGSQSFEIWSCTDTFDTCECIVYLLPILRPVPSCAPVKTWCSQVKFKEEALCPLVPNLLFLIFLI